MAEHINRYYHGPFWAVLSSDGEWVVGEYAPKNRTTCGPYAQKEMAQYICDDLNKKRQPKEAVK